MCDSKTTTRDCCGLHETLAVILRLQEHVEEIGEVLDTCDKPFLGPRANKKIFNTRPIMLFTQNNEPWAMPIEDDLCPTISIGSDAVDVDRVEDNESSFDLPGTKKIIEPTKKTQPIITSTVFRLEKLGPCTATFRVLIPIKKCGKCFFKRTDSFFTVNLCCFCAIKCLPDTFVECVC
ncbi:MAG: hypothetical protein ACOXZW_01935 [Bacilli bacterium]|jgi:hypothetical protein|nr:hypothetical protein [Bacilli bacterium]